MKATLSHLSLALALVLLAGSPIPAQEGKADQPAKTEVRVEDLPPGQLRLEWEVVRKRHPHGQEPGWVYKPGWSVARGCTTLGSDLGHLFQRICPTNGALMPDWAQTSVVDGQVDFYEMGSGKVPKALTQVPAMSAADAWSRILQAIKGKGAVVPASFSQPSPTLRILKDSGRSRHLRLVYQFAPKGTTRVISVDTLTGEMGGLTLSYLGAQGFASDDPLRKFYAGEWIRTTPRLRGGRPVD